MDWNDNLTLEGGSDIWTIIMSHITTKDIIKYHIQTVNKKSLRDFITLLHSQNHFNAMLFVRDISQINTELKTSIPSWIRVGDVIQYTMKHETLLSDNMNHSHFLGKRFIYNGIGAGAIDLLALNTYHYTIDNFIDEYPSTGYYIHAMKHDCVHIDITLYDLKTIHNIELYYIQEYKLRVEGPVEYFNTGKSWSHDGRRSLFIFSGNNTPIWIPQPNVWCSLDLTKCSIGVINKSKLKDIGVTQHNMIINKTIDFYNYK